MKCTSRETKFGDIIWQNCHGELHREDGPAVIWSGDTGMQFYYLNNKYYAEEEYKREIVRLNLNKLKV